MKTKTFFILCLLLGMAMTQVSAQKKPNGSHNVPLFYSTTWWAPIYCDGVLVDWLETTLSFHLSQFCFGTPDGDVTVWGIQVFSGTATSGTGSGEIFTIHEVDKAYGPNIDPDMWIWHGNYIGNQGHHYHMWIQWDLLTNEIVVEKTICN